MICGSCGEEKPHEAKRLCKKCYQRELYEKQNMELKKVGSSAYNERKIYTIKCVDCGIEYKSVNESTLRCNNCYKNKTPNGICEIIKKHHEDMKDDPESLSTEFIQNIIGRKCN